jgi:putative transcriptional regulator
MDDPAFSPDDVKALRQQLGLTQPELAREIGTTTNTIWRWEHGVQAISPPYKRLLKILLDKSLTVA